jgi:hypothetical protein
LAFDKEGHRVGYGKGFLMYFYPNANLKQLKLDSLFFEEELIEDIYETDVKLNVLVRILFMNLKKINFIFRTMKKLNVQELYWQF